MMVRVFADALPFRLLRIQSGSPYSPLASHSTYFSESPYINFWGTFLKDAVPLLKVIIHVRS